jgi:5-methylthioadenosine/S-adenosylhomocysteine deaminase
MTRELLIKGGYVVTVDPELGDLPDGDVLVRDDIIAAVGPALTASAPGAEVIDARGRLVIPGLVDTHRHVWQGAIGGFTPQITGAGYDPEVLHGIAPRHTPKDIYAGTLPHVYQLMLGTPEAAEATEQIGRFLRARVRWPDSRTQ